MLHQETPTVSRTASVSTPQQHRCLSYVLFNILPTIADIVIACVYFTTAFGGYFGLVVGVTMALYVVVTISITEWRTKFRRGMNTRDNRLKQMV